jgi:hypothetical protein
MSAVDDDPILDRYADPLAAYLGRTADQIRQDGLRAEDFADQSLEITFTDGSSAQFLSAFLVMAPGDEAVGIFTDACGYFEFQPNQVQLATASRTVFGGEGGA